jgi:hypothetical protein
VRSEQSKCKARSLHLSADYLQRGISAPHNAIGRADTKNKALRVSASQSQSLAFAERLVDYLVIDHEHAPLDVVVKSHW